MHLTCAGHCGSKVLPGQAWLLSDRTASVDSNERRKLGAEDLARESARLLS